MNMLKNSEKVNAVLNAVLLIIIVIHQGLMVKIGLSVNRVDIPKTITEMLLKRGFRIPRNRIGPGSPLFGRWEVRVPGQLSGEKCHKVALLFFLY